MSPLGHFGGPLSVDFTDVQKVRQRFSAICILIFKSKTSIKVEKYILQNTNFFFCFGQSVSDLRPIE